MGIPKVFSNQEGMWSGKSKLHLSWLPPEKRIQESESQLHIDFDDQKTFATIAYTWKYEGKKQQGVLLVCMAPDSKEVQVA
jgi:hypothetical protein